MGIPQLVGLLHQRAGVDLQPDRHLSGRHAVAPHRIAHAIGERAEPTGRIDRNLAVLIEPRPDLSMAGTLSRGLGSWVRPRPGARGPSRKLSGKDGTRWRDTPERTETGRGTHK